MLAIEPTSRHAALLGSVAVFLLTVLYLIRKRNGAKRATYTNIPPGYTGWPLIGEALSLLRPCRSTTIGDFMGHRIARFGKIFSSNLGGLVIVSADAELNRFVLQNGLKLFGNDWPRAVKDVMGESSATVDHADVHRQMRGAFLTYWSSARLQTKTLWDADELAASLLSSWRDGSVVSADDAADQFTFSMIVRSTLGMEAGEPETEKLRKAFKWLTFGPFFVPLNLPGTLYRKGLQARKNVVKAFRKAMARRMSMEENMTIERDDFLGWLMKNTTLSEVQICDFLQGVIWAAEKTNSKAIALAIYFLEDCPKAYKQLREEHIRISESKKTNGQRKLTWDDYKQMEFTHCVINETLRLGNVTKYIMKKARTDMKFKGFDIPRGCKVLASFAAVHLDPSTFENPEQFNPWRWLSISSTTKSNNFMPFGGGPRLCVGNEMSKLEIAVFLHHLILNFSWKLVEQDHPISLIEVAFPKGLPIKVNALSL